MEKGYFREVREEWRNMQTESRSSGDARCLYIYIYMRVCYCNKEKNRILVGCRLLTCSANKSLGEIRPNTGTVEVRVAHHQARAARHEARDGVPVQEGVSARTGRGKWFPLWWDVSLGCKLTLLEWGVS